MPKIHWQLSLTRRQVQRLRLLGLSSPQLPSKSNQPLVPNYLQAVKFANGGTMPEVVQIVIVPKAKPVCDVLLQTGAICASSWPKFCMGQSLPSQKPWHDGLAGSTCPMGPAANPYSWGDCDQFVLLELSGGALPFATSLASRDIKFDMRALYFCSQSSDEVFVSSTNFPRSEHLGPLHDMSFCVINRILSSHVHSKILVFGAALHGDDTAHSDTCKVLSMFLQVASTRVSWIIGSPIRKHALFLSQALGAGQVFALQTWWCTSFPPSWKCRVLWQDSCATPLYQPATPTESLLRGWAFVSDSHQRHVPLQEVRKSLLLSARTGQTRPLVAQELEGLFGYSHARTAPLLQSAAPHDSTDRSSVEQRRVSLLTQTLPLCVVALVLDAFKSCQTQKLWQQAPRSEKFQPFATLSAKTPC